MVIKKKMMIYSTKEYKGRTMAQVRRSLPVDGRIIGVSTTKLPYTVL